MKEITIRNGNNIDKIEVESREILTVVKDTIEAIFNEGHGVLSLDSPENTTHYPYLFLANSVIEYPKFD
jgi:uroporphyrinogen-III decarboxylase